MMDLVLVETWLYIRDIYHSFTMSVLSLIFRIIAPPELEFLLE
jgi:hypothetical protein